MFDWRKSNEKSMPEKKDFLNMEDITGADYTHAKRICKDFETKNLGEYHDLYVKSDTLLTAEAFNKSQNMCLEKYGLILLIFCLHQDYIAGNLKKTKAKQDLLPDTNILLMVEKAIRVGMCHAIHQDAKAANKYMKD